jgi:hypothetical protein
VKLLGVLEIALPVLLGVKDLPANPFDALDDAEEVGVW